MPKLSAFHLWFRLLMTAKLCFSVVILDCLQLCAQIIPDRSLPENSTIKVRGSVVEINGGTMRGSNLFHSFKEFSLDGNGIDTAWFNNSNGIDRIIGRVTGDAVSQINGLIEANGTADLFLFNSQGIIFGPNAALDIGGSFVASTAESLHFADHTTLSTVDPGVNPVLTVSIPVGLQSGSQPGVISVLGNELTVATGKTLALFGGDILLEGSNLTAPAGNIYLGSIGDRQIVELNPTASGWQPEFSAVEHFGNLDLTQTTLDVSGEGAGNIGLQANSLSIKEGGQVILNTFGQVDGGNLTLYAQTIDLNDSVIWSLVEANAEGKGADLILKSDRLNLDRQAQIILDTKGLGDGGDLNIDAQTIHLAGDSEIVARATDNVGNGGNIAIATEHLTLETNAKIYTGNFTFSLAVESAHPETENLQLLTGNSIAYSIIGTGKVGKIDINATKITLNDTSSIATATFAQGGGSIEINAQQLTLKDLAAIATETRGDGIGGNLYLSADTIELASHSSLDTYSFATGNPGKLIIDTIQLPLTQEISNSRQLRTNLADFTKFDANSPLNLDQLALSFSDDPDLMILSCTLAAKIELTPRSQWLTASAKPSHSPNLHSWTSQNLQPASRLTTQNSITEAQSWIVNAQGKIELLASTPSYCAK